MDTATNYMGLELTNPLVASPSPMWQKVENILRAEEAGAGAVVLHSLFEEQLTAESEELNRFLIQGTERFAESLTYFPDLKDYHVGPEDYLELIGKAKKAVEIPVIASLNGVSAGGWTEYAAKMEEAGADALELNVYFVPTSPSMTCRDVEMSCVDLARSVKSSVSIPVAVKIGPYFSSIAHLAHDLEGTGADALVMFNRFYQPDLDLEGMGAFPHLVLSRPEELRLRLRWVAILYGRVDLQFAITGGIHSGTDAVKAIAAGADVAMMTSALLKHGLGHLGEVSREMVEWMEGHGYSSVDEIRGTLSQKSVPDPAAYERANYMRVLASFRPSH